MPPFGETQDEKDDLEVTSNSTGEGAEDSFDPYDLTNPRVRSKVNSRINKRLATDRFSRSLFERGWFRNILFRCGKHWAIFDSGQWRDRRLPAWFPKTQTNKIAEVSRDLQSAILQNGRVPIKYLPATDSPADQGTADVGERVREVIYAEAQLDSKEGELASWFVDTGTAFLIPYYDYDEKHGMAAIPKLSCGECGVNYSSTGENEDGEIDPENPVCPQCSLLGNPVPLQPTLNEGEEPPQGEDGKPDEELVDLLPIGSLCADVCSGFEIRCDFRIRDSKEWTWFIRQRRYDVKIAKEKLGYKGGATEKDEEGGGGLSQYYLDVLSQVTDSFNPASGVSTSGGSNDRSRKVTAYTLYELPSEDFPEGICAIRVGSSEENIVELKPLDFEYGAGVRKGKKFLNIAVFRTGIVGGRFWGKTPLDDAIPLQVFRNIVDANIRLTVQRMGNPIWLNPKGSGVENFNGEPGWVANYNLLTLGGNQVVKPERLPADLSSLSSLLALRQQIDSDIERVSGTYFLQGGEAPAGVTAASALGLLDERAKKAMAPMTREWAKGWLRFDEMALEIARKHWSDARIRVVAGKNKKWQVEKFMSSDLSGAVNMEIDFNSLFPKSAATKRAEIGQLIQMGIVSPGDPQQRLEVLRAYGEMDMLGPMNKSIEKAVKEADKFLTKGIPPKLRPMVDDSLIHMLEHTDFANTDEFEELPEDQQDIWYAHIQAHAVDLVQRRMAFQVMQLDPDNPMLEQVGSGEAGAAAQYMSQMTGGGGAGGNQSGIVGNQSGSLNRSRKKGTTGNGPNQQQAQDAAAKEIPDIASGSFVPPQAPGIVPGQ